MRCFSLILFVTISATLATPILAQEQYRAPDGQVFERSFDYSGNLFDPKATMTIHDTLLVCSDDADYYLPRLRRFAEYALGDRNFAILDGRATETDLSLDDVTMVFFGRPTEVPFDNDCTQHFAGFTDYVEKSRVRLLDHKWPKETMLPDGRVLPLEPPVCSFGDYKFSEGTESAKNKKIQLVFSGRFTSLGGCLNSNFLRLFGFSEKQCEPAARCAGLWRYVNQTAE